MKKVTGQEILELVMLDTNTFDDGETDEETAEIHADRLNGVGIDVDSVVKQFQMMVPELIETFEGEDATIEQVALVGMFSGFELGFRLGLRRDVDIGE